MFDYIAKVNKRAKRIKIQFCPYRGLLITSPKKLSEKRLEQLCFEHKDWIRAQRLKHPVQVTTALPSSLSLLALSLEFDLKFELDDINTLTVVAPLITVQAKDQKHQISLLKNWLRNQARDLFQIRLEHWSNITGLHYKKLSVRSQKSRWGSCSSTGTISLNDQLLFMPPSVLDYIIIHELCHTKQPNHSADFWALVEQHCSDYRQQEQLLTLHSRSVPTWFRASLYKKA